MADIYTKDWYDEIRDLLNRNPDVEKSAPRGRFRVLAELRGDGTSPYIAESDTLRFGAVFDDGKCTEYYELDRVPSRNDYDFIFEFTASVFEGVAARTVDPIEAGLKGTIKITGDMRIIIQHADLVNVLHGIYAQEVETGWPKGKPPYGEAL
jgi:putative sterol carrier protein